MYTYGYGTIGSSKIEYDFDVRVFVCVVKYVAVWYDMIADDCPGGPAPVLTLQQVNEKKLNNTANIHATKNRTHIPPRVNLKSTMYDYLDIRYRCRSFPTSK